MNTNNSNSNNHKDTNLEIYQRYMELIYYTNDIVRKYPKSENFALVKEIKNTMYNGLRELMYAIKTYKIQEKLIHLKQLDVELSLLKIHIRISNRYKYISRQNYETWAQIVTNICNMLGGWINSCAKR